MIYAEAGPPGLGEDAKEEACEATHEYICLSVLSALAALRVRRRVLQVCLLVRVLPCVLFCACCLSLLAVLAALASNALPVP